MKQPATQSVCPICLTQFSQRVGERRPRATCSEQCRRALIGQIQKAHNTYDPLRPKARVTRSQPARSATPRNVRDEPRSAIQVTQIYNDRFFSEPIATVDEVQTALEDMAMERQIIRTDDGWVSIVELKARRLLEVAA